MSSTTGPALQSAFGAKPTLARYRVLGWLCLFAAVAYIQRNSIGVAESTIRHDLGLSKQQMGGVLSAFFLTYAIFQIPTGWLAHRWGTRRALPVLCVLWSIPTSLVAFSVGWPSLFLSRSAMGAAQAGVFPCATQAIAVWMPATRRGFASGALTACMSLGGACGVAATGLLLQDLGWRWTFFLYGVPGLVLATGFYFRYRDLPQQHPSVNAAELAILGIEKVSADEVLEARTEATPWLAMLTSRAMWAICWQQFFRAAGYIFFASWFPTYLQETRGVSPSASGFLTTLPIATVVVGSLVGGIVSDWILNRTGSRRLGRQAVAVVSMVVCAALIFLSAPVEDALAATLLISAGSFSAAIAGPCSYGLSIDMGGNHVSMVFSTMNMAGNVGAVVFPIAVPWILATTGSWDAVLVVFGGIYLAAAACWMLLNPAGTVFDPTESG